MFASVSLPTDLVASESLTWDIAKQIIQSQHSLAIYGMTTVVAIAGSLMLAAWIRNFYLRKRELERAIDSVKSEITSKVEEDFTKLTEGFKDEIGKIEKGIQKNVEGRMTLFDAEKARLFGLVNLQFKNWENVVGWMGTAITHYAKTEEKGLLRICVDALNQNLDKCKELKDDTREGIKKCLPSIPKILSEERKQIEDKLEKLPKGTTEQSETKSN